MAEFNYILEDGKYPLYKDGKPLTNPHDVVIRKDNEELARNMMRMMLASKRILF
jgi:hypothetical protein